MAKYKLLKDFGYDHNPNPFKKGDVLEETFLTGYKSETIKTLVERYPDDWELVKEFKEGDRVKIIGGADKGRYVECVTMSESENGVYVKTLECSCSVFLVRNDLLELIPENKPEELTFPRMMLVWDESKDHAVKRKVIGYLPELHREPWLIDLGDGEGCLYENAIEITTKEISMEEAYKICAAHYKVDVEDLRIIE